MVSILDSPKESEKTLGVCATFDRNQRQKEYRLRWAGSPDRVLVPRVTTLVVWSVPEPLCISRMDNVRCSGHSVITFPFVLG